jgi:hypothetical protein
MAVARSGNQMSGTSGTPTHCVGFNASCAHNSSGFRYSPQLKRSGCHSQRIVAVLYSWLAALGIRSYSISRVRLASRPSRADPFLIGSSSFNASREHQA